MNSNNHLVRVFSEEDSLIGSFIVPISMLNKILILLQVGYPEATGFSVEMLKDSSKTLADLFRQ